jgi:hypothetical protein
MNSILKSYFPTSSPSDHEDFYFSTLKCLSDGKTRKNFEEYTAEVIKEQLPPRLQPLIQQILSVDPSQRPTIDEIIGQFSTIFSPELGSLTAEVLVAQGGASEEVPREAFEDGPAVPPSGGAESRPHSRQFPRIGESERQAAPTGFDGFLDWLARITY